MNTEQLRALATLLDTLNEFNAGDGDTLNLKVEALTIEVDGGTISVSWEESEGLYVAI